jgi:hypothetical protein
MRDTRHIHTKEICSAAPAGCRFYFGGMAMPTFNRNANSDTQRVTAFSDTVSGMGGKSILIVRAGGDTLRGGAGR